MAAVVFDPTAFKARYPEFAAVADATLTACFNEAGLVCGQADCLWRDDCSAAKM